MSQREHHNLTYLKNYPPQYDSKIPHKFLVRKYSGEYEDFSYYNLAIVDTASEAMKMVEELYAENDRLYDLAIKDDPYYDEYDAPWRGEEVRNEERKTPFTDLENEWTKFTLLSLFPRLKEQEKDRDFWCEEILDELGLSDDEIDKYYDIINEPEKYFKKFMIEEKGISEEVADATILLNNHFYQSRFDENFDYDPVPYYPKN